MNVTGMDLIQVLSSCRVFGGHKLITEMCVWVLKSSQKFPGLCCKVAVGSYIGYFLHVAASGVVQIWTLL